MINVRVLDAGAPELGAHFTKDVAAANCIRENSVPPRAEKLYLKFPFSYAARAIGDMKLGAFMGAGIGRVLLSPS